VPDKNVAAAGYGKRDPIADNSTNAGRAQNRRVQLVVSGASIGVQESAPGGQSEIVPPASEQPRQQAAPPDSTGQANPPQ